MRLALTLLLFVAAPLEAQTASQTRYVEIVVKAASVARDQLRQQNVEAVAGVVFDTRVIASPQHLDPLAEGRFGGAWGEGVLRQVELATGMQRGTLADTRKCSRTESGEPSCTLRPFRAVVAATQPVIQETTATIVFFLWFQPARIRPFEVHHSQTISIDLELGRDGWTVASIRKGPPGTSTGG